MIYFYLPGGCGRPIIGETEYEMLLELERKCFGES